MSCLENERYFETCLENFFEWFQDDYDRESDLAMFFATHEELWRRKHICKGDEYNGTIERLFWAAYEADPEMVSSPEAIWAYAMENTK
jgi:hypothetical protein